MRGAHFVRRLALHGTACLATLALLDPAGPPPPRASEERAPVDSAPVDPRLQKLAETIERAFLRCDAHDLGRALSRRVKVYVSADLVQTSQGYFGADQLVLLLRRLFEGRSTSRFAALAPPPSPRSGQAILAARWLSRDAEGAEQEMRLSFTLADEGAAWSIREIRELK